MSNRITITWHTLHHYRAVIDLDDPRYADLSPDDFTARELSEGTHETLDMLECEGGHLVQVDSPIVTVTREGP